jgi:SAM-dependent methyltransferase
MSVTREDVRDGYAAAARRVTDGKEQAVDPGCCGSGAEAPGSCCGPASTVEVSTGLYSSTETEGVPEAALLASLGCGNPTAVAALTEGQTVLDLGSGGGIDVLLSAHRVGPAGKVYGLDMTEEMLALALENKRKAGVENVEFLKGYIEDIPLPQETVDVIISNCVINLSLDKPTVFREMLRVLKPGGRIGISDIVASDELTAADRAERGSYVGCIAGALSFQEYERGLAAAGFTDVELSKSHEVTDGMYSTIVKATKPVE